MKKEEIHRIFSLSIIKLVLLGIKNNYYYKQFVFLDEKNMYFFLKSAEIRKKVQKIRQYNKKEDSN